MATKIVTKNSSTASAVPTASDLVQGELAVNVADKRLFTEDNAGAIVELGTNPSGNVTFQDNGKAIFGAGSDLQIYHDGSNSYITDTTGGNFFINDDGAGYLMMKGSDLYFRNPSNADMIHAQSGGFVKLYHNGAEKIATTSTGIDVTGNLTMASGGSIVAGGANDLILNAGESGTPDIYLQSGSSTKVKIEGSNGNVGIGTSSIKSTLNLAANNSGQGAVLTLENTDTSITTNDVVGQIDFYANDGSTGGTGQKATIQAIAQNGSGTSVGLIFGTSSFPNTTATEAMRIDSSGNVGIGTSSPWETVSIPFGEKLSFGSSAYPFSISRSSAGELVTTFEDGYDVSNARIDFKMRGGAVTPLSLLGSGNVGIGTSSPSSELHISSDAPIITATATNNNSGLRLNVVGGGIELLRLQANGTERLRIDSSGNLLVGKTSAAFGTQGIALRPVDGASFTRSSGSVIDLNRLANDGEIVGFYKDGTTVGSIGVEGGQAYISGTSNGLHFNGTTIRPSNNLGVAVDNTVDLGQSVYRFDDIYATNGTIQTSDRNEKQDIEALSDAEQRVAVACKGLLRKFRWKDSVAEKGDDARTHFGIIAQDLQAAFAAEGLDAGDYAMFISTTWTDEETNEEKTRMGVRYSELLAFIISAI